MSDKVAVTPRGGKTSKGLWLLLLGLGLVTADQVIKVIVKTNMDLGDPEKTASKKNFFTPLTPLLKQSTRSY